MDALPGWSTWRDIPQVCLHRGHLKRTVAIALVVGTILCLINQFDLIVTGRATGLVWLKVGLTYLVPFGVSNYGIVLASYRGATQ